MNFRKYEVPVFCILIAIGIFLHIYKFGELPGGLAGDEASAAVEAQSLIETGKDRWGNKWPPYFVSWGSGQNVLYTYLSIPFIKIFGLNALGIRVLSGLFGLLIVPLVYLLLLSCFRSKTLARLGAVLYLLTPYFLLISRWSLEMNIIPCIAILILLCNIKYLEYLQLETLSLFQKTVIILNFLPISLAFFAYAPSIFIIPLYMLSMVIYYWQFLMRHKTLIILSFVVLAITVLPFGLFILKNNVLHHNLGFEKYVPFDIPLLLSRRISFGANMGEQLAIIKNNLVILASNFAGDPWIYNTTRFHVPYPLLIFVAPTLVYLVIGFFKKEKSPLTLLLFWAAASMTVFLLYAINLNRTVHLQSVLAMFIAIGIYIIYKKINSKTDQKIYILTIAFMFLFKSFVFSADYFFKYTSYHSFPKPLDAAFVTANAARKPAEPIAISKQLIFNYLYTIMSNKIPMAHFQKNVKTDLSHDNIIVHNIDHYYMLGDISNVGYENNQYTINTMAQSPSFIAILAQGEAPYKEFAGHQATLLSDSTAHWHVIRFQKSTLPTQASIIQ
jgi:4-amino-4-deoxy-L-arabinose transferase-like glycosyltransferase